MTTIRIDLSETPSLCAHCRTLLAEGHDPDTLVEAVRGETICFVPKPLQFWANLSVIESDYKSARFTRFRPFQWSGPGPERADMAP